MSTEHIKLSSGDERDLYNACMLYADLYERHDIASSRAIAGLWRILRNSNLFERLSAQLDEVKRELQRWQTSTQIEGDYVPTEYEPIQKRIGRWVVETLGQENQEAGLSPLANTMERCDRFIEEAVELGQAVGLSAELIHKRVDYVFSRSPGSIKQEIGGAMLTLYAAAESLGVDAAEEVYKEVVRVETPEVRDKVRRRQAEKREAVK